MKVVSRNLNRIPRQLVVLGVVTLFGLPSLEAFGQEKSELAFVADQAEYVVTVRPAKAMGSPVYRKLGRPMDRILKRLTDTYFKMSLVELKDIEHITVAGAFPSPGPNGVSSAYDAMVIRTRDENEQGFDMVTQSVSQVHKLSNKEYFEFERPLNQQYRFAYIADSRTIVWTTTSESMEACIRSGANGPQTAAWAKQWTNNLKGHFTAAGKLNSFMQQQIPPNFSAAKKLQHVMLSGKLGEQCLVKLLGTTPGANDAKEVSSFAKQMVDMGKSALKMQAQAVKTNEDKAALKFLEQMINSVKVTQSGANVEVIAKFKIDVEEISRMLETVSAAAKRTQAANNIRQVALAFHNFESAWGHFPSAVMIHPETGKKYSWRIAILPFIEQNDLYEQYDFSQEWNSAHNRKVTAKMPDVFRADSDDEDTTNSSWFLLTGPGGMFGETDQPIKLAGVTDGLSNTIMAVEAKRNIHWAQPEDIMVNMEGRFPKLGGYHDGGFNVAIGDGSVRFISDKAAEDVLFKMYTSSGGEIMDWQRDFEDAEKDN